MSKYFQAMTASNLYNVPVQHYFSDRTFVSENKKYIDFCSTNYLSLEYHEEFFKSADQSVRQWGALTQWARIEADCSLFTDLEQRIGNMLGYSKILLSHTISNGCTSHIPAIVGRNGLMLCDQFLHPVVVTGCKLASLKNSPIIKFNIDDLNHLEDILKEHASIKNKVLFVDGVHSLARYIAPIKELQYLCARYQAWLFIDDAHGFGIFGESPSTQQPWGHNGNGVISFCGGKSSRTFYTSSFGKAFCTHTAFTAIPEEYEPLISLDSDQFIYSAPVSPALIGMANAALTINQHSGEKLRHELYKKVAYFVEQLTRLNLMYQSVNNHPAVHVICGDIKAIYQWSEILLAHGIFAGIRVFPLTPKNESGFRFAITAANTYQQIDIALEALSQCAQL